jgi:membrane protein
VKSSPRLLDFLKQIYQAWIIERPGIFAAAIAYFGIFSIAPLAFIAFSIASLVVDQVMAYSTFYTRLETTLGPEAATFIQEAVQALGERTSSGSALVSIIGFLALLFAASGMFFQIQFALNSIFKAQPANRDQTRAFIFQRLFSFLMVIGVGLLVILSTFLNVAIAWLGALLQNLTGLNLGLSIINVLAFFLIITLALSLIYKILPNTKLAWRDVLPGAALAAVLALLTSRLLGIYFRLGGFSSAFAAASSIAVILIAINILAQIFLFGALFIREYKQTYGSGKQTTENSPNPVE